AKVVAQPFGEVAIEFRIRADGLPRTDGVGDGAVACIFTIGGDGVRHGEIRCRTVAVEYDDVRGQIRVDRGGVDHVCAFDAFGLVAGCGVADVAGVVGPAFRAGSEESDDGGEFRVGDGGCRDHVVGEDRRDERAAVSGDVYVGRD